MQDNIIVLDNEVPVGSTPGTPVQPITTSQQTPPETTHKTSDAELSEKKRIVNELAKKTINQLVEPLVRAALAGIVFPARLEIIAPLQKAYEKAKEAPVKSSIEQAIRCTLQLEEAKKFHELLQNPYEDKNWQLGLLMFLAQQLGISYEDEPVVEMAIKEGKVYWRIKQNGRVLYDRTTLPPPIGYSLNPDGTLIIILYPHKSGFDFSSVSYTVELSWPQFRTFKDAGKRSSTVAITPDRFAAEFPGVHSYYTNHIWFELKQKGILNNRNRLSDAWRDLSAKFIELAPLSGTEITYQRVADALHAVASNPAYAEKVGSALNTPPFPGLTIFRPERPFKEWKLYDGSYRIANRYASNKEARLDDGHWTRLWDVGTYSHLDAHRNPGLEEQRYKIVQDGEEKIIRLNFDHIPSGAVLRGEAGEIQLKEQLKQIKKTIKSLDKQIASLSKRSTRSQGTERISSEIQNLQMQLANENAQKKNIEGQIKQIKDESPRWLSIAIPKPLHRQGDTFQETLTEQKKTVKEPLLQELNTYFNILEERWNEFLPDYSEYLKALGGFRRLCRDNFRQAPQIVGVASRDDTPYRFFQARQELLPKIDEMFHSRLARYIRKTEGVTIKSEVPRRLDSKFVNTQASSSGTLTP